MSESGITVGTLVRVRNLNGARGGRPASGEVKRVYANTDLKVLITSGQFAGEILRTAAEFVTAA